MAKQMQYHLLSSDIASIYRYSKQVFQRQIMKGNLRRSQHDVVMFIYDHPGLCQRQIAGEMSVNTSLLARDLKDLISQGYVTKHPNPADKRSNVIVLTSQGAQFAKEEIQSVNSWWRDLFQLDPAVDPDSLRCELDSLKHTLQTMENRRSASLTST